MKICSKYMQILLTFFSSTNIDNDITTRIKQQSKKLHGEFPRTTKHVYI